LAGLAAGSGLNESAHPNGNGCGFGQNPSIHSQNRALAKAIDLHPARQLERAGPRSRRCAPIASGKA